jgi:putative membrane protein
MRRAALARVLVPGLIAGLCTVALGACERRAPRGAEAALRAEEQPKPVLAAVTPQPAPTPSAQAFVAQASAADAFEIAAAQAAQQKATHPAVRAFADMMVHDHTESQTQLKAALAQAGQPLSASAQPDAEQQRRLAAMAAADAGSFDRVYLQGQVAAHQTALGVLQSYAQNGDVPALTAFAGEASGTVQRHLTHAKSLLEQIS